jgi:hypothetical protein
MSIVSGFFVFIIRSCMYMHKTVRKTPSSIQHRKEDYICEIEILSSFIGKKPTVISQIVMQNKVQTVIVFCSYLFDGYIETFLQLYHLNL